MFQAVHFVELEKTVNVLATGCLRTMKSCYNYMVTDVGGMSNIVTDVTDLRDTVGKPKLDFEHLADFSELLVCVREVLLYGPFKNCYSNK